MDATKRRISKKTPESKFKIRLHPTFLLLGVFYCFTGDLPVFLISTLVAVQHEFAHFLVAEKLGYRLDKLTLFPFGAVIEGNTRDFSLSDEIKVALAGPICNLCTALFFLAVWWLFPLAYAYTDLAESLSMSMFLVNMLPCYPLDGGRVFYAVLAKKCKKKTAKIVTTITGISVILGLILEMILRKFDLNLMLFCVFLVVGFFSKPSKYEKRLEDFSGNFISGATEKTVYLKDTDTVKKALSYMEKGKILRLKICDGQGNELEEISQKELMFLFENYGLYENFVKKQENFS